MRGRLSTLCLYVHERGDPVCRERDGRCLHGIVHGSKREPVCTESEIPGTGAHVKCAWNKTIFYIANGCFYQRESCTGGDIFALFIYRVMVIKYWATLPLVSLCRLEHQPRHSLQQDRLQMERDFMPPCLAKKRPELKITDQSNVPRLMCMYLGLAGPGRHPWKTLKSPQDAIFRKLCRGFRKRQPSLVCGAL